MSTVKGREVFAMLATMVLGLISLIYAMLFFNGAVMQLGLFVGALIIGFIIDTITLIIHAKVKKIIVDKINKKYYNKGTKKQRKEVIDNDEQSISI